MSNTLPPASPSPDERRSGRVGGAVAVLRPADLVARFRRSEFRNEAVALVAILLAIQLFPRSFPSSLYLVGVLDSAGLVLNALAVVLVFRANRFVNFAQLQLAAFSGFLFFSLVQGQFLLDVARSMCGCVSRTPGEITVAVNYVVAVLIAVAVPTVLSAGFYATVLRRFTRAPRLMLTLFMIFTAQFLHVTERRTKTWFTSETDSATRADGQSVLRPPWDFEWTIDTFARINSGHVVLVLSAVVALVGTARYLRSRDTGVAIRAASESPDRARTLGVDVVAVTSRVWLVAGLLAGVSGVVSSWGDSRALGTGGGLQVQPLAILLLVAILAKFRSFPMIGLAAVVVSILRVAVPFSFRTDAPLDAGLVFLVGGILLLQRHRETRADREDASGFELVREVRPIPKELRYLPQVGAWVRNGAALGVLVLLGLPWALSESQTTFLTVYVIFVIIGLSVLVVTGWMGQVSLGQFGFAMVGAWGAAVSGVPMPLAVLLGGCLGAVAAVVVGVPALRLKGLNLAVSTLAFAVSAVVIFGDERYLGERLPPSLDRPSILGMDFDDPRVFYYAMVVVVACAVLGVTGLRRSRTGRTLIAVRANEATGQSFGVDVMRLRLIAFAVSGFLAAVAGALFAFQQKGVDASSFTPERSIDVFVFSVFGGLGGVAGPICGFAFMALVEFFPRNPVLTYLGGALGGMLVLMAAPGGLAQLLYDARDAALRRLAVRLRIPVPSLMGDRAAAQTFDRAPLDEHRRGSRPASTLPLRYRLPHQWALDRFGSGESRARQGVGSSGAGVS